MKIQTNKFRLVWTAIAAIPALLLSPSMQAEEARPLHVLYVTGGGWHDYAGQVPVLTRIIEDALCNVKVSVSKVGGHGGRFHRHPAFEKENWAEGFDLVVYNKCNAPRFSDDEWIERIVAPHREGLPAVLIHGTLHNFWPDEKRTGLWNAFCGVTSRNHEAHAPVTNSVKMPDHPIMAGLPAEWSHEQGELYRIHGMQDGVKSLLVGVSSEGVEHTTVWTHQFGKGRVFGNSLGHVAETMNGEEFQRLMRQGIQWAVGQLPD